MLQLGEVTLVGVWRHIRLTPLVGEQVLLILDQFARRVDGPLKVMTVVDRIGGTGIDTETAEDAAPVIDLVDFGVPMILTNSLFVWALIICAFNVDRIGRTSGSAEKAGDALLLAILINVEKMLATETAIDGYRILRIANSLCLRRNVAQRHAHSLSGGPSNIDNLFHGIEDISKYRHIPLFRSEYWNRSANLPGLAAIDQLLEAPRPLRRH